MFVLEKAIVRIYDSSDSVKGVGFLAAPGIVLTCHHVVGEATEVTLDFPHLKSRKYTACLVQSDPETDIAALRLEETPPDAEPVRLVRVEDPWNHPFRAFGFPAGHPGGVWASGVLRGPIGDSGWLQIEDTNRTGYLIQPGFSGGPVWDEEVHGVVGMVVTAEKDPGVRAAFCIPAQQLMVTWPDLADQAIPPNPYRGLFHFREQDAPFFFGREAFSERLLAEVERHALTAVIGPSGSGKSSVVFAGLLPRLRLRPDWAIATARPGRDPFAELALALLPLLEPAMSETGRLRKVPKLTADLRCGEISLDWLARRVLAVQGKERLLVVVDQFEELYTLCDDKEARQAFVDQWLTVLAEANTPLRLVLTLRADFLGQALTYRPLADRLDGRMIPLGPMSRKELEAAVVKPAEKQGVAFEEGLVARILEDVGEEPGNLPLLEFALTRLWEQQTQGELTHAAYEAIGGVVGALERHAEAVYEALDEAEQARAREAFIQLVRPGEGTEDTRDTRRRATQKELGAARWDVVRKLADERLVVTGRSAEGEEVAEIAHEALIRRWARLQRWVEEGRAFRVWQERTRALCRQWEEGGRDEGALLRGVLLTQAQGWLEQRGDEIEKTLRDYIRASAEKAEAERRARERLRRRIMLGLIVGLVVALALLVVAGWQWGRAERQRQIALARQWAAQAFYMGRAPRGNTEALIAPLLAMESLRYAHSLEAYDVLQGVLFGWLPLRTVVRHKGPVNAVAFSPDGRYLATASRDNTVALVEVATGREVARIRHEDDVNDVAFSPDGRYLATASGDGTAALVEVATGREVARIRHEGAVWDVAFSPDGRYLATASRDNTAALVEVATGLEVARIRHEDDVNDVTFSLDGRYLATASRDNTVALVEVATGREVARIRHEGAVWDVAFSPDGRYLATASRDNTAALVEVATGLEVARIRHEDDVNDVAFSPDGRYLATASGFPIVPNQPSTAVLVEVTTGREVARIRHEGAVRDVVFSPDGRYLATTTTSGNPVGGPGIAGLVYEPGTVALVEVGTGQEVARIRHEGRVNAAAFSPDGRYLATASGDGTAALVKVTTGREVTRIRHEGTVRDVVFSPDERYLATASGDGTAALVKVTTGREVARIRHEGAVWDVVFSPDGRYLATASRDNTAALVEVTTGREVARIRHEGAVRDVAFSPDGRYLATAGGNDVHLFPLDREELFAKVCARLLRNLTYGEWRRFFGDEPYRPTCPNRPLPPDLPQE